jgi:DNA-binding transcriptional LysR family regulator
MDTINAMKAFAAVARHRSFTRGAIALGLSVKVASKYVAQLEAKLQVQLLTRTTRKVTLTEMGTAYLERCLPLLEQFDELESVVREKQSDLAGLIRINAPTPFGIGAIVPALATFQAMHPRVELDLQLVDHRVDIVEEGFDLTIRFGDLQDSTLMARKLAEMPRVICAAPEYFDNHTAPSHPLELSKHNCLLQESLQDVNHWQFKENGKTVSVRVAGKFRSNSLTAVTRMAAEGLGIARTTLFIAKPYIDSGQLKVLLNDYAEPPLEINAVYPQTKHLTVRVRALIDHLAATLSDDNSFSASIR